MRDDPLRFVKLMSFQFLHAADLHLDSPLVGLNAHEGAPVEALRGATRRALENLVNLAIEEQVAFLTIAGDVFDGDWRDYSTGLFFRRQTARLREAGIPVYLIAGNHDAASVITKRLTLPENVHVFSTRTAESTEVPDWPVVIHGRGFPHRAVSENWVADYPEPVAGKFNIGLLHTSLTGRPGHDTYAPCSETDLRNKGYDYWGLGHIHQPEIIARNPWIVFPGNLQGRHAGENGPRGCHLVSVDDSLEVQDSELHAVDVVRWQVLVLDLLEVQSERRLLETFYETLAGAVAEADGRLVACRVQLTGSTGLHGLIHRERDRLFAEFSGIAQDLGTESVWIEKVRVTTSPVYEVGQLAVRDDLTRVVLEAMAEATKDVVALPEEVDAMLAVLPPEVRQTVESEWDPMNRTGLLSDVQAIILESLARGGGEA